MPGTLALPGGWASQTTDQGMVYYYNVKTGETTWEHPGIAESGTVSEATAEGAGSAAAPAATTAASAAVSPAAAAAAAASSEASAIGGGWEAVWADEHKMYYYCNRATGAAQWERPEPDQTGDQEPQPPTSSSGEGEGALPEDVRGGVDGSIEGSANDGTKGGNDGGSAAGKDSVSSNLHHRREESPSTALKPTGESNDRRVPVEPRYGGQHSTHPEPTHQPTQQKQQQQQQQHASPLNVNTAFDWTKAGGATAAPSPKPRAQMPATVAEPRTVVGSAPPPTDKEGVALRQALSRREESLRRLEEVRAGARSRLAALKAETDARRASRSALKAKGSTNSIKSSSSFGSTSSSASGGSGSGGVLAAPKSAAVAAAAAAAERQERTSFDGRRFAPGSTADAAATTARRASFAGHTGGGFSARFESSPPPGSRFSTAVGVMPPPLPPRSRAGRKKEKEAPAPMTAGEPSFEQLPPPPPAAAGREGSTSREAPASVPDPPGRTAAATGDEGGVRRCDEAVALLPVDEGRGVRPALPGGATVGSGNSTHSTSSTSSLHTNSTSSTKSIGSSTQEASGRELIHTAREERQAPTSAAQGGVVVDGLAATTATAAAGGGGTGPLVGEEEGAAEKEGSEAGGRGPAAISPPALAKVNDVRAFKALWRETDKIRGTAAEPEGGERDSGEGLDREKGGEEAQAEEVRGGGKGGGEGENGEVLAITQDASGENGPVVDERSAATQEEATAGGQPEGRESEGCESDGNGVGGSGSTGGAAVDRVELDAVVEAVAAAGDCVGKGTATSHESGGKEEVAAVDSVELDPVVAAKAAGGDCVGKGTTTSHEGGEEEEGRELGAEENVGEREKVQAGWGEVDLSGAAAGEEVATIVAALAARPEQDSASDGATTVSSKGDGADDVRHAGTVEVYSSRGDGGGDGKETAVVSVAKFATAMECAIGLAAEAAAAAAEKEPPASTDGEEMPQTSPQETDDARGPSPQATFADVAPSAVAAPSAAAAAPAAARMAPPPPLSSFSSISMCSSSLPSPARSPACPSVPPATALASALDSATRRVSRLRELLGSVGEAEAWAGLLGGDDGRLCCRRLADLALSAGSAASTAAASAASDPSSTAACRDNSDAGGGGGGGGDAAASARALCDRSRQLCSDALGCLAICGRIRTGVWVDLSRPGDGDGNTDRDDSNARDRKLSSESHKRGGGDGGSDGHDGRGHQRGGDDPAGSRLTRLLSLCVALAEKRDASAERTGLNEHEYFFGMGSSGEAEEQGAEPLSLVGLTLIYEILTGSCKSRAEGLRGWSGMSGLVRSLLDLIAEDREERSYMGATRCLLAANNPVLRGCSPPPPPLPPRPPPPPEAGAGAAAAGAPAQSGRGTAAGVVAVPARPLPPSTVIPALLCHPARHEVQGAVLHIFNEEGYPNGDAGLARLCLAFCSDAYAEGRTTDLFYVNDVKVMIDIIVRELYNLPAEEALRMDYRRLLRRLLEESEWSTKGDKYRERDIERAAGITTTT